MTIQTQITLDLVNRQAPAIVHAKQYDGNTRQIVADLTENGAPFIVPSGTIAIFQMAKPDGTYVFYDSDEAGSPAVVIDGSTVTVTLIAAALQVAGDCPAQIDLYNAGDKLTSFTFVVRVQKSTVPDDAISETYVNVLTELIGEAQEAAQQAEAAIATTAANAAAAAASASAAASSAQEAADAVEQIESELPGYVPNTRTVNGKALSTDIMLDASDVGARDATWMPTASEVGAVSADVAAGTITWTNGTDNGSVFVYQGKVVQLYLRGKAASLGAGQTISNWANIPASLAPRQELLILSADVSRPGLFVRVKTTGAVDLQNTGTTTVSAGITMFFNAVYIAQ